MTASISRRDFLKAAGILPLGMSMAPLLRSDRRLQPAASGQQNILIIVFDAFSARHLSFHGYERQTTPNLRRLLDRAIVYHNHYACGNFTTPGTASLLTGTLPWTHRALQLDGRVNEAHVHRSIFRAFPGYHRAAYSHNPLVNTLLRQFMQDLDQYVPMQSLLLTAHGLYDDIFVRDMNTAGVAWERALEQTSSDIPYSLFLPPLRAAYIENRLNDLRPRFPLEVPVVEGGGYFLLEEAIDWLQVEINRFPQPFLGYFHLMPPHEPSRPPEEFHRYFAQDGLRFPSKPVHPRVERVLPHEDLVGERRAYDEFILYADREFGRLFEQLESSGILDSTWVILTSDHGELFERGFHGHLGPLMYEPVLRVPLLLFEPGRTSRLDVHDPTSAVDVLPTLLWIAGREQMDWTEGAVLPPFAQPERGRTLFALHADETKPRKRITQATAVLVRSEHKLIYTFGDSDSGSPPEVVELYDLESDAEEMVDQASSRKVLVDELVGELKARLTVADEIYG
jgi:arylsulfatase A-like enzyme